jgi:hypothetical protein
MTRVAELYPVADVNRYFGPARVIETDESENLVRVCLDAQAGYRKQWAKIALPVDPGFALGDEVLVAGDAKKCLYIIGILTRPRSEAPTLLARRSALTMQNGAYAVVVDDPRFGSGSEVMQVFSKHKQLLFEYDPVAEKTRVCIASGDLVVSTQTGDITFNSARKINLDAQTIVMTGRSAIRLRVADVVGRWRSWISLGIRKMEFDSPELDITAQRSSLYTQEMRYIAKRFLGKVGYIQLIALKVETVAQTIVEKVDNIYKTVRNLSQLKVGRKRTIVESTYHLKTGKTIMKSDEDFKVNAKKIHLG